MKEENNTEVPPTTADGHADEAKKTSLRQLVENIIAKYDKDTAEGNPPSLDDLQKLHKLKALIDADAEAAQRMADELASDDPLASIKIKRPYTLTKAAHEARIRNAQKSTGPKTEEGKAKSATNGGRSNWKHGKYSASAIHRMLGVCSKHCGQKDTCQSLIDGLSKPGELCLGGHELPQRLAMCIEAVKKGTITADMKEATGVLMGMQWSNIQDALESVAMDGTTVLEPITDRNGRVVTHKLKSHPALAFVTDALHKLGVSLTDQNLTPRENAKNQQADDQAKALQNMFGGVQTSLKKVHDDAQSDDGGK